MQRSRRAPRAPTQQTCARRGRGPDPRLLFPTLVFCLGVALGGLLVRTEGRAQATSCFEPISVWHLELVELTLIDGDATAAELGSESEKWARSEAVIDVYSEDRAALSARGGEVISLEAVP